MPNWVDSYVIVGWNWLVLLAGSLWAEGWITRLHVRVIQRVRALHHNTVTGASTMAPGQISVAWQKEQQLYTGEDKSQWRAILVVLLITLLVAGTGTALLRMYL